MKNLIYNLLAKPHFHSSVKGLKKLEAKLTTPKSRFAIPFVFQGKGHFKSIRCMQNAYELERMFHLVCELCPETVLEIGTAKGGALYLWMQAARKDAVVVSVDLPGGEFGGGYPSCRVPFYQLFAAGKQKLHLVRADSHAESTHLEVKKIFGEKAIDFLFIDGDHTYEGVKQDFESYGKWVRPGGLIGFHDILPRKDLPDIQVDRFWKEIKGKYADTMEIVGPEGGERQIGCGILRVPKAGI